MDPVVPVKLGVFDVVDTKNITEKKMTEYIILKVNTLTLQVKWTLSSVVCSESKYQSLETYTMSN